MALSHEQKSGIVKDYQLSTSDTGSPEVQVALLTSRITDLSDHFKEHNCRKPKIKSIFSIYLIDKH